MIRRKEICNWIGAFSRGEGRPQPTFAERRLPERREAIESIKTRKQFLPLPVGEGWGEGRPQPTFAERRLPEQREAIESIKTLKQVLPLPVGEGRGEGGHQPTDVTNQNS